MPAIPEGPLLREVVALSGRVGIKQIMLAFVFLRAFLAPESSWEGQTLSVRKMLVINDLQWLHVQTSCKSSSGSKGEEGESKDMVYVWAFPGARMDPRLTGWQVPTWLALTVWGRVKDRALCSSFCLVCLELSVGELRQHRAEG